MVVVLAQLSEWSVLRPKVARRIGRYLVLLSTPLWPSMSTLVAWRKMVLIILYLNAIEAI